MPSNDALPNLLIVVCWEPEVTQAELGGYVCNNIESVILIETYEQVVVTQVPELIVLRTSVPCQIPFKVGHAVESMIKQNINYKTIQLEIVNDGVING